MACNHVGGLSGAFIPVSEDAGMIKAVERRLSESGEIRSDDRHLFSGSGHDRDPRRYTSGDDCGDDR